MNLRATSMDLVFGPSLSKFCEGPWWCDRTLYEITHGTPLHSVSRPTRSPWPLDDN